MRFVHWMYFSVVGKIKIENYIKKKIKRINIFTYKQLYIKYKDLD